MPITPATRKPRAKIASRRADLARIGELFHIAADGAHDHEPGRRLAQLADLVTGHVEHSDRILAAVSEDAAALAQLRTDMAAQVADGTTTAAEAAKRIAAAEAKADASTRGAKAVSDDAARLVRRRCIADLYDLGDSIVTDVLAPCVHATADRIRSAGDTVIAAGVTDDNGAARGTAQVHAAWNELHAAHDHLRNLWRLAEALRSAGYTTAGRQLPDAVYQWRNLDATVPDDNDTVPRRCPAPLRTWQSITRGAGPTVHTAAEAAAVYLADA